MNSPVVERVLKARSDIGAGMAATEAARKIQLTATPTAGGWRKEALVKALEVAVETLGAGRLFVSDFGRKILIGSGKKGSAALTNTGILLDNMVRELRADDE
jgi:hypothetical protein